VQVRTANGTTYLLDPDARTVLRIPAQQGGELRCDAEPIPLLHRPTVVLGEPMVLLLRIRDDGIPTVRTTTPVLHVDPSQ
jgi:hypothetical protein